MWTRDGGSFLSQVFKRIEEVIPPENLHKKVLVDDHSTDDTRSIAIDYGWAVYANPKTGIASGANEALCHVDCKYFVSVEQDVLLARDWWGTVAQHMNDEKVAVAQGVRFAVEPTLRRLDEYLIRRDLSREDNTCMSLDNNIYKTSVVKSVGGFPEDCPICADRYLRKKIVEAGYKWLIDENVISEHLQTSLSAYYHHAYVVTKLCSEKQLCSTSLLGNARVFATSPVSSLKLARRLKWPPVTWVYPISRFYCLKASLERSLENSTVRHHHSE
jgi:glycosyltransferase involved in cell wall biosynthesis